MQTTLDIARTPAGTATECWPWPRGLDTCGYGIAYVKRRHVGAHRVAYEHFVGPVPDGMELDHLCGNRSCFNPAHLQPVTHQQNSARRIQQSAANTSGYRGVSKYWNRWRAYVYHGGVKHHLGAFDTPEEAALVAAAKRAELGFPADGNLTMGGE